MEIIIVSIGLIALVFVIQKIKNNLTSCPKCGKRGNVKYQGSNHSSIEHNSYEDEDDDYFDDDNDYEEYYECLSCGHRFTSA